MRPTILTSLMLIASHGAVASRHFQRNIISDLVGAASTLLAGGGENTATPPSSSTTSRGAPATATSTNTKSSTTAQSSTAVVSTTLTKSTITASTASSITITSNSRSTTNTSSSSSTITSSSTSSASTTSSSSSTIPVPSNPANAAPSPSPVPSEQGGISGAGIAVAVILSLFVLGVIAWLIFRYHPRSRAWWAARQEKKFQERSYRDAIDGPGAGAKQSRRALGSDGRKSTYLASFFAPRTVKLGDGKEIRRKPVQWGAKPGEEKVPLTNMASPMGRSPVSPVSALEKPLPTPTIADRTTKIYELA